MHYLFCLHDGINMTLWYLFIYLSFQRAKADNKIRNMKMTTEMKDATTAPLTLWQKSVNCWQIASQFALGFPLWAKYTIAAAEEATAVVNATITCIYVYLGSIWLSLKLLFRQFMMFKLIYLDLVLKLENY